MSGPSLAELASPTLAPVTVRGKAYTVAPIDGFAKQLYDSATPDTQYQVACKIVARATGLSLEDVFGTEEKIGWSPAEVMLVVDRMTTQTKAVEATSPNGSPAGAETSGASPLPSPESRQPIQSVS